MKKNNSWWHDGIIYQIYPRSFADSNGDGFGDLTGIASRLDYLQELGVDAIWMSPFFPSPDADFGYDVSDYTDIDPRYGNLADFDRLLAAAHERGIRVILDMVLNHTSDQHAWFMQSRRSRENSQRDWYIWQNPGPGGGVPNNWQASFGGSAWEFDPITGQYYLHSFLKEQPDLNWRCPAVRQAILDVFRFWLERGVDGFRLDVFNAYFKDSLFRSNPPRFGLRVFDRQEHIHDLNQPEMIDLLQELRKLWNSYPDRYAVGETFITPTEKAMQYVGDDRLHAIFSFDFFESQLSFPWKPRWLMERTIQRDRLFDRAGVQPTTVLSNHDQIRTASRYCKDGTDRQARIAMALLLTLRGTPYLYYGEEIGMRDIQLSRAEIMDPPGKKYWPLYKGRDGCRSPMQWSSEQNAGFSRSKPWLKVHPDYPNRNVAGQQTDPNSMLNFTRKLIALRRAHAALRGDDFRLLPQGVKSVIAFERKQDDEKILVYLNFSGSSRTVSMETTGASQAAQILLTSCIRQELILTGSAINLHAYEVLILKV